MKYKISNYLKKYIKYLIIIFILSIVVTICDLKLPEFMAKIIDVGIKNKNISYIYNIGIYMIIFTILGIVINIIVSYFSSLLSNKITYDIRNDLYDKIVSLDNNIVKKFSNASLINRLTNDVDIINQSIFMILRIVIIAPIITILATVKIFNTNINLSIILIISIILMFIIIILLFKNVFPKISYIQKLLDKINLFTKENISGIKTIKSFNSEKYHIKKFMEVNKEIYNINNYVNKITLLLSPLITFIIDTVILIVIYIGSNQIILGNLKVGVMLSYIEYIIQIMTSFLMISILFIIFPKLSVSYKRIKEIMNSDNNIINEGKKKIGKSIDIEFKNVCFSYSDNKFLQNINFKINSGEKIGIVGGFASGKSTLIDLITRINELNSGEILINGINIKEYNIENLRDNISICYQNNTIVDGTIKSNLLYSKKTNKKDIEKICKISKINEFVKLEDINKYKILNDGKNLSGGQIKRICIARALLKKAYLYIFDDCTSSIDYKNSSYIINNIKKYLKDKTVIFTTQRIFNVKDFDKIIAMDKGKIIGIGTHEYLLKTCKIYKELYDSQTIGEN